MKKVLVFLSLVLTTAFLYAANTGESNHGLRFTGENCFNTGESGIHKINTVTKVSNGVACTVTLTASVGYSATYVSASCSSTRSSCDAAITEASSCVKSALAAAKKNIK